MTEPPRSRSSLLQHPAFWVVLVLLALVMLIGALLDRPARPPADPEPVPSGETTEI